MPTVKAITSSRLRIIILGSFLALGSIWSPVASSQEPDQTFATQLAELKTKVERLEAAVEGISSGKPEGNGASSPDAVMDMKSQSGKGMEMKGMGAGKRMEMKGMAMGNDGGMAEEEGMGAMGGNETAMGGSAFVPIDSQMIQMQMIKMKMMEMQVRMMEMQMKMKMMELN